MLKYETFDSNRSVALNANKNISQMTNIMEDLIENIFKHTSLKTQVAVEKEKKK